MFALLKKIPRANAILNREEARHTNTRASDVNKLIESVEACKALEGLCAEHQALLEQAITLTDEAEALRWQLAMSARYLVDMESSRLANTLMTREDLRQYGYVGLLKAAKRFEPDKGVRFTSYARWWVRAEMTRSMEKGGRAIRLPGGAVEQLRRLRTASRRMERDGSEPTARELADETGMTEERVRFLRSRGSTVSMDAPITNDGLTIADQLAEEPEQGAVDDRVADSALLEQVEQAMSAVLDERSQYILRRYFGLDGEEETSLSQLGRELNLSRERVRQLRIRALRDLRGELGTLPSLG
ncbi:MAG: sigma-70 family RNA polymerase sigma factor [Myxococcota bacterium]